MRQRMEKMAIAAITALLILAITALLILLAAPCLVDRIKCWRWDALGDGREEIFIASSCSVITCAYMLMFPEEEGD